jgi:hypothetical protein
MHSCSVFLAFNRPVLLRCKAIGQPWPEGSYPDPRKTHCLAANAPGGEAGKQGEATPQSSLTRDSRSALAMTLTEDSAIAAAPTIGDSKIPNTG